MKNLLRRLYAKLFERSRTSHVSIRLAVAEDAQFVFDLALEQVKKGHLNTDYLLPAAQKGFSAQVTAAIGDAPVPMPGQRNGAGARVAVMTIDEEPVGFAWFLEERPGSWDADVELHLVALKEEFQGRGLGRLLVEQTLASVKSQRIYARCKPASSRMLALLKARGFAEKGPRTPSGTVTVERRA